MTIKFNDLKNFTRKMIDNGYKKVSPKSLRKAIMQYWNVGSKITAKNRIESLKDADLIKPLPNGKLELTTESGKMLGE